MVDLLHRFPQAHSLKLVYLSIRWTARLAKELARLQELHINKRYADGSESYEDLLLLLFSPDIVNLERLVLEKGQSDGVRVPPGSQYWKAHLLQMLRKDFYVDFT